MVILRHGDHGDNFRISIKLCTMGTTTSRRKTDEGAPLSGWHDPGAGAHLDPLVHTKLFVSSGEHELHPHMQGTEVDFFARSMSHLQSQLRVATGHSKTPFHIVTRTMPHRRLGTIGDIKAYHDEHPEVRLAATPDDAATLHPHKDALPAIEGGDKRRLTAVDSDAKRSRREIGLVELPDGGGNGERKGDERPAVDTDEALGERKGEERAEWSLEDVITFVEQIDLLDDRSSKDGVPVPVLLYECYGKIRAMTSTFFKNSLELRSEGFCKLVEHVAGSPSLRKNPFILPIIAQLWNLKYSKIFEHVNLDILPHELIDFLCGRTRRWEPRPQWKTVQQAAHPRNGAELYLLLDALIDLAWVIPSEIDWLIGLANRVRSDRLKKSILRLKGMAISPDALAALQKPFLWISEHKIARMLCHVAMGRSSDPETALARISVLDAFVNPDRIQDVLNVRSEFDVFSDDRILLKHLKNLIRKAPRRGNILWAFIITMFFKGTDSEISEPGELEDAISNLNAPGHPLFQDDLVPVMKQLWQYLALVGNLGIESLTPMCVILRSFDSMRTAQDFDGIRIIARLLYSSGIYFDGQWDAEALREKCHGCDWEVCLAALRFIGALYIPKSLEESVLETALSRDPQFMLKLAIETNSPKLINALFSNATFKRTVASGSARLDSILEFGMRRAKILAINELSSKLRTRSRSFLSYLRDDFVPSAAAVQAIIDAITLGSITPSPFIKMVPAVQLVRAFQLEGLAGMQRVWRERGHSEPALIKFMVHNVALVAPPDRPGAAKILIGRPDTQASAGDLMIANGWEYALDVIKAAKTVECRHSINDVLTRMRVDVIKRLTKRQDHMTCVLRALRSNDLGSKSFVQKLANHVWHGDARHNPLLLGLAPVSTTRTTKEFPSLESLPDASEEDSRRIFMPLDECTVLFQIIGTCYFMSSMASMFMSFHSPGTATLWKRCFTIAFKKTKTGRVIPVPVDLRKEVLETVIKVKHGHLLFLFLCFVRKSLHFQAEILAAGDEIGESPNAPRIFARFRERLFDLTHWIEKVTLLNQREQVPWIVNFDSAQLEGGFPEPLIRSFVSAMGLRVSGNMVEVKDPRYVIQDKDKNKSIIIQSYDHVMALHAAPSTGRTRSPDWFFSNAQDYAEGRFRRIRYDDELYVSPIIKKFVYEILDPTGKVELALASTTTPSWQGTSAEKFVRSILQAGSFTRKTMIFLYHLDRVLQVHLPAIQLIIGEQDTTIQSAVRETIYSLTRQHLGTIRQIDIFANSRDPFVISSTVISLSKTGTISKEELLVQIRDTNPAIKRVIILRANEDETYTEVDTGDDIDGTDLMGNTNPEGNLYVVRMCV